MHEWGASIHSNQQEMAHMLEAELHTRVPWGVHMVVEHPLGHLLWMLQKIKLIKKKKIHVVLSQNYKHCVHNCHC